MDFPNCVISSYYVITIPILQPEHWQIWLYSESFRQINTRRGSFNLALALFNIHKILSYCPDVGNLLIVILALGPGSCKNYSRCQKLNNLLSFCCIKDCLCSPVDELSLCLVVIKRNSSCSLAWQELRRPQREHSEFFLSQIICTMYAVSLVWK